ncbi:MAG: hypothetical protein E6Q97_11070 [Desulfurellales bacterium]|nr:MAG: hypothetical protein E6Q97_11070 [Desulfurellales bacterium]
MLTRERFLHKLNTHLDRREFRAALSWCEQGIYTLANQPAHREDDSMPVTQLPLSADILDTLDLHGVTTIGQLRAWLQENASYYLGTGKPYETVCRAVVAFDERARRGMGPHGQGSAAGIRSQPRSG